MLREKKACDIAEETDKIPAAEPESVPAEEIAPNSPGENVAEAAKMVDVYDICEAAEEVEAAKKAKEMKETSVAKSKAFPAEEIALDAPAEETCDIAEAAE
jgi:hypothetical protein